MQHLQSYLKALQGVRTAPLFLSLVLTPSYIRFQCGHISCVFCHPNAQICPHCSEAGIFEGDQKLVNLLKGVFASFANDYE